MKFLKLLFTVAFIALQFASANAQLKPNEIDDLVHKTLKTFDVPGIQVGIVKDGKLIHAKGYGLRSLNTKQPVDANTEFGIASNTKAFTAFALGMLIDENKLTWDTHVTDIIPEFKMYDPYVTSEFTVRDLLCHRSGLGLGAGDLMFWPDSNTFSKAEIIHNLRYLKPVSSFRTQYDYDNLLYIVAGEVVERISGVSWENFIQTRIFKPLDIKNTYTTFREMKDWSNVIDPHAPVNGQIKVVRRDWSNNANAAGGIYTNVSEMSKWMILLLNGGKYGANLEKRLISEKNFTELWTPQTIIPVKSPGSYNTHFASYGLGWFISDVKGYKQLTHTGGLAGIVTQTTLLPELNLAIMVYTNQQSGAAFNAITATIKDSYLGIKGNDRVKEYSDKERANFEEANKIVSEINSKIETQAKNQSNIALKSAQVLGEYQDPWFGLVTISMKDNQLWFTSQKSLLLQGAMTYYNANTYLVKWIDRSFEADAFVKFNLDTEGKASGFTMEAISPLTDFSFDFQDLDFSRK
jgi:CubicO group peptidase (beta-lactamase class C family)